MSSSFTYNESATFTVTHARHIAAKVATDLKRMQAFYGSPTDAHIAVLEEEITFLLRHGYLDNVCYGFKRDGNWIEPMLRYAAPELGGASIADNDPGRVKPGANVDGAWFYSYLIYSSTWINLPADQKERLRGDFPLQREGASAPGITGYLAPDLNYAAGGRVLQRASLRSY